LVVSLIARGQAAAAVGQAIAAADHHPVSPANETESWDTSSGNCQTATVSATDFPTVGDSEKTNGSNNHCAGDSGNYEISLPVRRATNGCRFPNAIGRREARTIA